MASINSVGISVICFFYPFSSNILVTEIPDINSTEPTSPPSTSTITVVLPQPEQIPTGIVEWVVVICILAICYRGVGTSQFGQAMAWPLLILANTIIKGYEAITIYLPPDQKLTIYVVLR